MYLYRITKQDFSEFLANIKTKSELYAPIKTDAVRFQKIDNLDDIYLKTLPDFSVKEFFFRQREKLFSFNGNKVTVKIDKPKTRVFFGLRRCDLNAIAHQDFVFMEKHKDPYYIAQRKGAILLGYHCNEAPSKYCFCGSMDLKDCYDLMFWDKGNHFLVDVGSDKGKKLIDKNFKKTRLKVAEKDRKIKFTDRLKKKDISNLFDNPNWEKGAKLCISCASCTTLCPTCYCHEIKDETKLEDLKSGDRIREWSSCQLKDFSRVAGNHIFREPLLDRFKHRIYHQLQYFKERYNIEMCVGCGRCITHCPTDIDFVQLINEMKDE
ncbi:MAG: 4Fe-4S dicluster domain-containing protein [Nanoarchaeota archaeon]